MSTVSISDEFMVVLGATTAFFIFFLDAQCFEKKSIAENKDLNYEVSFEKKEILLYAFCSLVIKGSIGITFFIQLFCCFHSKKLCNRSSFSETNNLHNEREISIKVNNGLNSDDIEFLNFLRYLNYHLNHKHYDILRGVPFYVKTNIPKTSKLWIKKLSMLDAEEILKRYFLEVKNILLPEIAFALEFEKEIYARTSSTEDSKSEMGVKESYLKSAPLHQKRIRRYVDSTAMKLKLDFKFQKPAKDGNTDVFQRHLISQLAKAIRVPITSINDMKVMTETDVTFTLSTFNDENNVMDDNSVIEAGDSLKAKIRSRQLQLKDLNGQPLMTTGRVNTSMDDSSSGYSLVIVVILCIILLLLSILIITVIYIARRISRNPRSSAKRRNEAYKDFQNIGRDSSQSVGKYSYDSGLWLGPGPEPNFTVPEAPYYRPPTEEQIASTPRPVTAVRTRLRKNWNVDERALSTIPDNYGRNNAAQ